jgi:bacteriochlorophyllide c C-7(1)-hydroxylase
LASKKIFGGLMNLDMRNPAHLKICLLSDGFKIDSSFFNYFDSKYQGSPYHYSKDNEFEFNYPHHMILNQNTVCGLNIDENSPWILKADEKGFYIYNNKKEITAVDFPKKYSWLNESLDNNLRVKDIAFMTTPYSMNIFVGKECFFFNEGLPCHFCGFKGTRDDIKDKEYVSPKTVQQSIKILENYDTLVNQIYFVGSTNTNFDKGYKKLIELVDAANKVIPSNIDIIVTSFPPKDLSLIKKMKEAGADRVSFAIEMATPELFKKYCPGKEKYYGYNNFVKALKYCSDHFYRSTYFSAIQGFDKEKVLINFMKEMIKDEIMATMNIYYNSPYSILNNKKTRPTKEYLYNVTKMHQEIFAKSNMRLFSYGADRHCLDWEAFRQMI